MDTTVTLSNFLGFDISAIEGRSSAVASLLLRSCCDLQFNPFEGGCSSGVYIKVQVLMGVSHRMLMWMAAARQQELAWKVEA